MQRSYRIARKLYKAGRYRATSKIAQSIRSFGLFDLDYNGYSGRKIIPVDPSTYRRVNREGSVEAFFAKTGKMKRITIRKSQINNYSAWLTATRTTQFLSSESLSEDSKPHTHEWVDTGMKWTFCKKCNTTGWQDPMKGGDVQVIDKSANSSKLLNIQSYRKFILLKVAYSHRLMVFANEVDSTSPAWEEFLQKVYKVYKHPISNDLGLYDSPVGLLRVIRELFNKYASASNEDPHFTSNELLDRLLKRIGWLSDSLHVGTPFPFADSFYIISDGNPITLDKEFKKRLSPQAYRWFKRGYTVETIDSDYEYEVFLSSASWDIHDENFLTITEATDELELEAYHLPTAEPKISEELGLITTPPKLDS